jgi:choline dehydrogenase-like flavoprotein
MLGKSDTDQVRSGAPRWAGKVSPGMPFEVLAHHAVDFWLCGEDLPLPESRVTVGRDDTIHLALDEDNNMEGSKRLLHKLDGMLGELGMHPHRLLDHSIYLHKGMPIGATAHQAGTVRFGRDPASSALDVNCKAHDLDNLYVVDTLFDIGAVNPPWRDAGARASATYRRLAGPHARRRSPGRHRRPTPTSKNRM